MRILNDKMHFEKLHTDQKILVYQLEETSKSKTKNHWANQTEPK